MHQHHALDEWPPIEFAAHTAERPPGTFGDPARGCLAPLQLHATIFGTPAASSVEGRDLHAPPVGNILGVELLDVECSTYNFIFAKDTIAKKGNTLKGSRGLLGVATYRPESVNIFSACWHAE